MTVAELIERLLNYDTERVVEVCEASGDADFRITDVCDVESSVTIWVENVNVEC